MTDDELEGRLLAHRMAIAALARKIEGGPAIIEVLREAGADAVRGAIDDGETVAVMLPCLDELSEVLAAIEVPDD